MHSHTFPNTCLNLQKRVQVFCRANPEQWLEFIAPSWFVYGCRIGCPSASPTDVHAYADKLTYTNTSQAWIFPSNFFSLVSFEGIGG